MGTFFWVLSSQQRDPDGGNLDGLQKGETGHEENFKEATDPGRKVGLNLLLVLHFSLWD